jgi:O-antigen ligase
MIWLLGIYMWLFVHRPFEIYPALGDLYVERLYVILMLACWVASPWKDFRSNRLHLALGGFVLAVVVCWAASPYRDHTGDLLETYFKVCVFYPLVVTTVRDERDLRRLVAGYLIATGLYMAHSILEYLNGRYEWRMGISRMVGVDITYRDPNAFASTLVMALPLTMPFWKTGGSTALRLALAGFTAAAALCVFLTGSRGGFVALTVAAVMLAWASRYRTRMLALLAAAGVVGVLVLPGALQDRFLTLIDSSRGPANAQESAQGRLQGLLDGVRLWEQSPLLGMGPWSFAEAAGSGYNPHNMYGQVLGEMGLVGVAALAALLLAFWANAREARRLRQSLPPGKMIFASEVCRGVALTILLLLLLGSAGHNLYRYNWLWLAAFQAAALQCLRRQAIGAPLPARRRPLPRRRVISTAAPQPA